MFGKKSGKEPGGRAEAAPAEKISGAERLHAEGLGDVWAALTGRNPAEIMPQVAGTVLSEGGTRPAWGWKRKGREFLLMAWPKDQPIRAAILMAGPEEGRLKPVSAFPLLEGAPNDLLVEDVHPRGEGYGGDVAAEMLEGRNPMWFFDPLFSRDRDDLTPGVMHTFWLAAAAYSLRPALLDAISITRGPQFEAHVEEWLKNNPDKSRLDAPPLKIEIKDKHIVMPGRFYGEYIVRAVIEDMDDWHLDKMPVKSLHLIFPFEDRPSMLLPVYVSKAVLGDYEPKKGDEIEAYVWLQGRIIDLETETAESAG